MSTLNTPKRTWACRWAMLGELKPKGPKGFRVGLKDLKDVGLSWAN